MTLLELQAKRDEIVKSIGVVRAQHGDYSVEYADAQKALALIDSEISRASTTPKTRQIRLYSNKGF